MDETENRENKIKWKYILFYLISCLKKRRLHSSCCECDVSAEPSTPTEKK